MNRFRPGNRITLLTNGDQYFPALIRAIDAAREAVWFETYIFADDATGRLVAGALIRAAQRGVHVRALVDGWGARFYLSAALEREMRDGGVDLQKYRPEVAPWQFRSHRLRRLHRKLCVVDGAIAFVGGINVIDDSNTPRQTPPRIDFAVAVEGPLLPEIEQTMQRVWGIVQLVRTGTADLLLFPERRRTARVGTQTARFVIRDNLRHRRDIERAYLAAIRTAKREIIIANSYFFPGIRIRHALVAAAQRGVAVTLLLPGRVEYLLLHLATRAMYGQLLQAGIVIEEYHRSMLHAKVAVVDDFWATVGSSNIDPYSLLMAREANVIVRDRGFNAKLKGQLRELIAAGSRRVVPDDWQSRSRSFKAAIWIAYGIVRMAMGLVGYGGNDWFNEGAKD
ncbi:MAG: cardiolipin synthase ClsB [Betaproteobacteria bacterium]